jgi:hypothetical protein
MSFAEEFRAIVREENAALEQRLRALIVAPEAEFITPAQAGKLVTKSAKTIRKWAATGAVTKRGDGERILVSRAEVLAYAGQVKVGRPKTKKDAPPSSDTELQRLMGRKR